MTIYLDKIQAQFPRLLSRVCPDSFSPAHGCGDRLYWSWKFTDFPGARYQEYLYTLAWLYTSGGWDNPWRKGKGLNELLNAGFAFWSRLVRPNGSLDEAYPLENSLAAASFTLFYLCEAYELCKDDLRQEVREQFKNSAIKVGNWLNKNDEKHGFLSNHLSAAAAALQIAGDIFSQPLFTKRSKYFIGKILSHQSSEGWYDEYGGADPGYQTHGSFYLARIWQRNRDEEILNSLRRANEFLSYFVHPDGSLGGEYSSRNTGFYFPAAYEILASHCSYAKGTAQFQRDNISLNNTVGLEQMDAPNFYVMLNNYVFAHQAAQNTSKGNAPQNAEESQKIFAFSKQGEWLFPRAELLAKSTESYYAVVSLGKGGIIRIWDKRKNKLAFQSSGYLAKIKDKWYSSQSSSSYKKQENELEVIAPFSKVKTKLFNPFLFMAFRLFSLSTGRFSALTYWLKSLLVKTLVTKEKSTALSLKRTISFGTDRIIVKDALPESGMEFIHQDKFSAIHMGSSRYIHVPEELARQSEYRRVKMSTDTDKASRKFEVFFDQG